MAQAKISPAKALKFWESLQPLIALYNLHLASPPTDKDKEKIKEYLRRYAPHIFLYQKGSDLVIKYGTVPGTLPEFQRLEGRDWFSTEYFVDFCQFCRTLCWLLGLYADQKFTGARLVDLQELLLQFRPTFMLRHRATRELYSIAAFWDAPLDTQRYELLWGGGIVETGEIRGKYKLDVSNLLAQLTFSFYRIVADGVRVVRCQRKKCPNIFVPRPRAPTKGKLPRYCPRCRSKRKN
jgi:hypothetical protein